MEQYTVTGMRCAECSTRVEKAVSKVPGVTSCSVSLLTNSMGIEGTASEQDIVKAVTDAGYGASKKGSKAAGNAKNGSMSAGGGPIDDEELLKDRETPVLKKRLLSSLVFLIVLMYFSMGHMMWGWPLPAVLADNHIAMGLIQMLLTIAVMVINQKFFISGFKSLFHESSQYGYTRGIRLGCGICIQHVCAVCHDRCTGAWQYGRCYALHARILF